MNRSRFTFKEAQKQKQIERKVKRSIVGLFDLAGSSIRSAFVLVGILVSRILVVWIRALFFVQKDFKNQYRIAFSKSVAAPKNSISELKVEGEEESIVVESPPLDPVNDATAGQSGSDRLNLKSLPIRLYLQDARLIHREREEKDSLKLLISKFGEENVAEALIKIQAERPEIVSSGQVFFRLSLQKNLFVNVD